MSMYKAEEDLLSIRFKDLRWVRKTVYEHFHDRLGGLCFILFRCFILPHTIGSFQVWWSSNISFDRLLQDWDSFLNLRHLVLPSFNVLRGFLSWNKTNSDDRVYLCRFSGTNHTKKSYLDSISQLLLQFFTLFYLCFLPHYFSHFFVNHFVLFVRKD